VMRSRLQRGALGPLGWVAGAAAVLVAVDVVTGARLQLNGVAGYSALAGGRYAGHGTVGLGVFVAGNLLGAGCLALQVRRPWRPGRVGGARGRGYEREGRAPDRRRQRGGAGDQPAHAAGGRVGCAPVLRVDAPVGWAQAAVGAVPAGAWRGRRDRGGDAARRPG